MNRQQPDHQLGEKERYYLARLEEFRRQGVPLIPSDFCNRVGLKGTSSIKRYKILKRALREYGWATQPDRMRGDRPDVLDTIDLGPDPRLQRLQRQIDRLTAEKNKLQPLQDELRSRELQLDGMRGILMAMVTHFAAGDYRRARDIEQQLFKAAREHLANAIPQNDAASSDNDLDALLDEIQKDW